MLGLGKYHRRLLANFYQTDSDHSDDSTVFSLRSGIDFLFQSSKLQDYDTVNIMIVGTSDGGLHLSIYDSFAIGNFPCPLIGHKESLRLIDHTFHRQLPTQCLLMANKSTGPEAAHLILMDLPFISSSPINLSLLASKLTTLQALLRYLKQTQLHMQVEWNNTRELPGRFLRSVETDLESMPSGPRGIVPALYHTVVTGHTYEPVREWLVDSLTERVSGLEAFWRPAANHLGRAINAGTRQWFLGSRDFAV